MFPIGPYEHETNKFAAELLIDNYDIKDMRYESISHIVGMLGVNEESVAYKLGLTDELTPVIKK